MDNKIIGAVVFMLFVIMVVLIIMMSIMFWYSSNDDDNNDDDNSVKDDVTDNVQDVTSNLDLSKVVVAGKIYQFIGSRKSTVTLPSNSKNGTYVRFNNISSVVQKLKANKPIKNGDVSSKLMSIDPNTSLQMKFDSGTWNVESTDQIDSCST